MIEGRTHLRTLMRAAAQTPAATDAGCAALHPRRDVDDEMSPPVRVMFVISSLEHGGAERQVVELANRLDPRRFRVSVCSLSEHVPLAPGLLDREGRLHVVRKRWPYDLGVIRRVAALMRRQRVQLAHAFLFDAEMVARLAARLAGVPVVIASERNTDYRLSWSHWICKRLTRSWFDLMIANSEAGKRFNMRKFGIAAERIQVIRNGVDVERFRPLDRAQVRRQMGIAAQRPVVGMVATFKRQKNHGDFFRMAQRVRRQFPEALFVCAGEPMRANQQGADDYHREIRQLVRALRLEQHTLFLGNRDDMPEIYNVFDVTVLPSSREGTPNVLLESMACGTPVVATSVSDNAFVVPEEVAGFVVPPGEVPVLTQRVCQLLSDAARRQAMGQAARQWVAREFSTDGLVERTAAVYQAVLRMKRAGERRNNAGNQPPPAEPTARRSQEG